jgi:competence ComEA-like helix-hairpin-helix protein
MKKLLLLFLILFIFPIFITATGTVEINTASLQQLDELTGIGPKYAQAIIDGRPFYSVDDLLKVKGIGPATLQKIKDQGLAYVSGAPASPATTDNITVVNNTNTIQNPIAEPIGASNEPKNEVLPAIYPSGIYINEILPNPKGADETDEWIELYNSNNTDADLSGWQLQDTAGTVKTYTIPQNTKLPANGFLVLKRPETKIMLNNDGDGINLLTPDKKIIDSIPFAKGPLGQSYNKINSPWAWSQTPTPGAKNIIIAVLASSTSKTLPNAKNSVKNDSVAADISQSINLNQDSKTTNPWFLFFIVLATTIILAALVLITKIKLFKKQNHVRT